MTVLAFDASAHRYAVGDRELLGVTAVPAGAGLIDGQWFSAEAAQRGSYVHQAIALAHEDDLAIESLDPVLRPYVDAYLRFVAESGFQRVAWEERVWSEALGCAGTLDLRGHFP